LVTVDVDVVARLRSAGCVYAEDEARLLRSAARSRAELDDLLTRRLTGVPLEQVIGFAEFCGLRVAVDPGVFVPRRRTEFLVSQAVTLARPRAVVIDMCCGSGAIGAAIAAAVAQVELYACDIDPAAVRCARRNLVGGHVYEGDLYEPLPSRVCGRVDAVVASAPYVPTDAIGLLPAEARLHEPRLALDGGIDGMDVQRRVIDAAPPWLVSGGHLFVECSEGQASPLAERFTSHGLASRVTRSARLGATVVIGTKPLRR
jgi:release factor glutamine methyltransferase